MLFVFGITELLGNEFLMLFYWFWVKFNIARFVNPVHSQIQLRWKSMDR